ncbi:unnamed protein product [Orchesella dallaii]|uniref:Uncharacterized protein n=1 Tax=Orchesella dallaii TaxID=48710 RepID=A0ABP1PVY7_9HEXA
MEASNYWRSYLNCKDFQAVGVREFNHVPFSGLWDMITLGTMVEVESQDDVPGSHQPVLWVASINKIHGYYGLLRYEGAGNDPNQDFWIHLCSPSIHHVGWCAENGKQLIPPQSIVGKFPDLRDFLLNSLTGKQTLSHDFQALGNQSSQSSCFQVGDQWEVVDKDRICQLKVATVQKVVGQRLYMKYFDSTEDEGFWLHERSRQIHPMGWAKTTGHEIVAPVGYHPRELPPTPSDQQYEDLKLEVGMKMEAINPLRPCVIGVATIKKVLKRGYVMVRVEGTEMEPGAEGNDWVCYHITSPNIFPCGFCEENGILLTPPKQWEDNFYWTGYLDGNGARAAPVKLREEFGHGFWIDMKVEAVNRMEPSMICPATITRIEGRLIKIHFDGWEEKHDQWLDAGSPDIYPIGYCELVHHKMQVAPPPQTPLKPEMKVLVGGGKSSPDHPPEAITPVSPAPSEAERMCARAEMSPEAIETKARVVETAPPRPSFQAANSSQEQFQLVKKEKTVKKDGSIG